MKYFTGLLYDPSLEHTKKRTKTAKNFYKVEERSNGDLFGVGKLVEKVSENKSQILEDVYDINKDIPIVVIDTTNKSVKK